MVDRTTAARAIKKLEMNGFIEKRNDAHNKKIKKLYPTEKALTIYPSIIKEHEYSNTMALDGIADQEIEQLFTALQKVRKNVEVDWEYVKKGNKRKY